MKKEHFFLKVTTQKEGKLNVLVNHSWFSHTRRAWLHHTGIKRCINGWCLPKSRKSLNDIDLLATPSKRCSPAWALSKLTWGHIIHQSEQTGLQSLHFSIIWLSPSKCKENHYIVSLSADELDYTWCNYLAFQLWFYANKSIVTDYLNFISWPITWSSRGSSPKAGMYLAHSTNTNSCCLIESHMSPTVADFSSDMSARPTGVVICWKIGVNVCHVWYFKLWLQYKTL